MFRVAGVVSIVLVFGTAALGPTAEAAGPGELAPTVLAEVPPVCPVGCQGVDGWVDYFDYDFAGITSANGLWTKQSWTWGCQLDPGMVTTSVGVAELRVPAGGAYCGQIDGKYNSYFYGRYRASMKLSPNKGVVNSIFFYGPGGESEIDIEYLTKENDAPLLHLIAHPNNGTPCGGASHKCYNLPFDPAQTFHVYGFDIHPDRIDFFVDEQQVASIHVNIPQNPGVVIFNNWAIGDWPGPAPLLENVMYVDWALYEPFPYCDVCAVCGDGLCTFSENCVDCASECGECGPPPAIEPRDPDPPVCIPQCRGRECGDDGCGGSCGMCGRGTRCRKGLCIPKKTR